MNTTLRSRLSLYAIAAMLAASTAAYSLGLRSSRKLDKNETRAAVTVLTASILQNSQFAHHELDDELAGKFLDRYLDSLDSSHMNFLQSDVAEFAKYRRHLAQDIRNEGDTAPAKIIFKRYMDRLEQRADYIDELLKTETFDFTKDESFRYDRKNAPRPVNIEAAHDLWHQQLRFEYLQEKLAGKTEEQIAKTLRRRSNLMAQTMRKLNDQSVLELYLNALAHVYDPHSDYMGREEYDSFSSAMNLSLVGIGATLESEDGYCKVHDVVAGGPAARGGLLKSGDRIVGVAQGSNKEFTDLVNMPLPQAVDLIRGAKGTTVKLSIIPAGAADTVRKTIAIVRDEVKLEEQQAKASVIDLPGADGKPRRVGVIDLPGFYSGDSGGKGASASATADVSKLVRKLKEEHIAGLVLDLRHNGGGSLEEAINLAGLFLPHGPIVQTRTVDGRIKVSNDHRGSKIYDGPLVVLTSRLSASASEIVAGALQDYGRAVIVGDSSTFGKGTVQTIVPLTGILRQDGMIPGEDPGALKVTISKFYRPSGKSTQLEGVKADIVLPSPTDTVEIGESELDNPLPWDTIAAASFKPDDRVHPVLDELRSRSIARVNKKTDFIDLKKELDLVRKNRESKTVSLNETTRRQEKDAAKERAAARDKARLAHAATAPPIYEITVKNASRPGLGEPVKSTKKAPKGRKTGDDEEETETTPADDILLTEAERIAIDYSDLLAHDKAPAVTQR